MNFIPFTEIRLIIAKSTSSNNIYLPYLKSGGIKPKLFPCRISLIKTLKTYVKKYCQESDKYNILYLSILYLDIILSKNKISLTHDKNLKFLCLCCFLISLKLIGNYDTSKKIIINFCRNYRQDYKYFEAQCLQLLDDNLVFTTAYDYLNMILLNESKKLLFLCNSILYQLCEENLYTYYSPFYISVAIYRIAKNTLNDDSYNHYDKYFNDERVKFIIKQFNYGINPPIAKALSINDGNKMKGNIKSLNLNNTQTNPKMNMISKNNYKKINITNKNIITSRKTDNNLIKSNNINNSYYVNKKPKLATKYNNLRISKNFLNNYYNNCDSNFSNITSYTERNTLPKFNREMCFSSKNSNNLYKSLVKYDKSINKYNNNIDNENDDNSNRFNHKTITIRQTNLKRSNCKIISHFKNSNYLLNNSSSINNYKRNSYELKKKLYNINNNKNKEESLSTDIQTPNQINNNNNNYDAKKRDFHSNKSSLNFQLVSGVSKEKLLNISRNLSKNMKKGSSIPPNKYRINK
jgi:hypothetical protein